MKPFLKKIPIFIFGLLMVVAILPTKPTLADVNVAPGVGTTWPVSVATTLPVNCVSGCSSSGGGGAVFPAPSSSPFPISASTTLPVSVGNFPASQPITAATTLPVICVSGCTGSGGTTNVSVGQYNPSPFPTYAAATAAPILVDNRGVAYVQPIPSSAPFPISVATSLPILIYGTSGSVASVTTVGDAIGASAGVAALGLNLVYNRGTSQWNRMLTSPLGTEGGSGALGAQTIQGSAYGVPVPVSIPTTIPVNCISGCSGGSSSSSYTYNSTFPTLTSGTPAPAEVDQNGLVILSPQSSIQTSAGQYNTTLPTYQNGQQAPMAIDNNGHLLVSADKALPISIEQLTSVVRDFSGAIATGGSGQLVAFSNPIRHGLLFQNLSSTPIYINFTGAMATAGSGSVEVFPSAPPLMTPPNMAPQGQVTVYGATTGQAYTYQEW